MTMIHPARLSLGALLLLAACGNGAGEAATGKTAAAVPPTAAPSAGAMLPTRELDCTLGLAKNIDTRRRQTLDEMVLEGRHRFALTLPSIPVRQGPPPDPIDPPEPVDPRTRVTADPDGLRAEVPGDFDRVIDLWPERVEMVRTIDDSRFSLVMISNYQPQFGTAQMMLTRAHDAASFELDRIYMGLCKVKLTPAG